MTYLFRSLLVALIFFSHSVDAVNDATIPESSSLAYEDREVCSFRQHEIEDLDVMGARFHVVECYVQDEEVGSLSYVKMPIFNTYVIDSFYVHPEYRNKGYGSALLNHACDYLKTMGATAIYLQPGPFNLEKVPEGYITTVRPTGELYEAKLQQLIAFYKKNQFHFTPKWATPIIWLLYKAMRIDENAEYLMVKNIQ